MPRTLYLNRDEYGNVMEVTFKTPAEAFDELTGKWQDVPMFEKRRKIRSYKDLVWAMCQSPCRRKLFDAAWRRALKYDAELSQAPLSELGDYLEEAKADAEIIGHMIGELVNDPGSRFFLHG